MEVNSCDNGPIFTLIPDHDRLVFATLEIKRTTQGVAYSKSTRMTLRDIQNPINDDSILNQEVIDKITQAKRLFNLYKIKVFSKAGKIIYSTDTDEIGNMTRKNFFKDIAKHNSAYSLIELIQTESTFGKATEITLVETYVPIIGRQGTVGIFEIYYDISEMKKEFNQIVMRINYAVLVLALLLLLSVIISALCAKKSYAAQKKAEKEKNMQISRNYFK